MDKFLKIVGTVVVGLALIALGALLVGFIVMLLWNWLMPVIFGLTKITYIQGWGISFLSGLLFKGTSSTNIDKKN